jgi:hypothetical protein
MPPNQGLQPTALCAAAEAPAVGPAAVGGRRAGRSGRRAAAGGTNDAWRVPVTLVVYPYHTHGGPVPVPTHARPIPRPSPWHGLRPLNKNRPAMSRARPIGAGECNGTVITLGLRLSAAP